MPASRDGERRMREVLEIARAQGYTVREDGKRALVFLEGGGQDKMCNVSIAPSRGATLPNSIASLKRIGVDMTISAKAARKAARPTPPPSPQFTAPTVHLPANVAAEIGDFANDVSSIVARGLVSYPGEWRDLSLDQRAHEVWQAGRLHCARIKAQTKTMHGTTYHRYQGPLSDFFAQQFPTMPFAPEDGNGGTQGQKPVYEYLKANQNVITNRFSGTQVQWFRHEYNEVTVVKIDKPKPVVKAKRSKLGKPGTYTCDVAGCDGYGPYTYKAHLGSHKSKTHGISGVSASAKVNRRTRTPEVPMSNTVLDLTTAISDESLSDLDAALSLVREEMVGVLTRASKPPVPSTAEIGNLFLGLSRADQDAIVAKMFVSRA